MNTIDQGHSQIDLTAPLNKTVMGLIVVSTSKNTIEGIDDELINCLGYKSQDDIVGLSVDAVIEFSGGNKSLAYLLEKGKESATLLTQQGNGIACILKTSISTASSHTVVLQCVVLVEERVPETEFGWLWQLPDSIFIHNFQVITYVNKAFLQLFGFSHSAEILGRKIPDTLVHPDDFDLIMESRKKALSNDVFRIPNFRALRKDGSTFLAESQLSSIIVNNEPHLQVVSRDVTERKAREERTLEINLLMKESQKLAHLGSWQWDVTNDVVTWSEQLFAIYGFETGKFNASFDAYLERVHQEDRERVKQTIQDALETGEPVHFEERIIRPDGEMRYLKSWGQMRSMGEGDHVKMFGACLDITERKKSELESLEKEYQLERFADSVHSAIIVANEDGAVKYWNQHAANLFGYSKEEAIQLNVADLIPLHHQDSHKSGFSRFKKAGKLKGDGERMELEALTKKGDLLPIELSLTSWKQGKASFECAVLTDITDRKKAKVQLANSERRFRDLFENSLDGIYKSTSDGKFVEVNPALVKMLGYGSGKELMSIDIKSQLYFEEEERETNKEGNIDVYRLKKKNGDEIWVEDHGRYEPNKSGEIVFHAGVLRDFTARKNAEDKLIHSLEVTMEQNKRLLDFSYIVSHNLRSHTSNISGVLSLLEMAETDEEKADLMEMLRKVADALDDTMHHLNNVVNIQTENNLLSENLCLYDYINRTKEILVEQIHSKNALIQNKVDPGILVNYNVAYLESILLNFISNSIKYSSPNRRLRITMDCKKIDGFYELSIQDNGLGIDLEKYGDSLFGMYKTFHDNRDARGIGLFISKNQIESMGGTVRAISEVDKGSTFFITINGH